MQGFIPGSRASLMLDVVSVSLVGVIPTLTWSLWLVKQRRYALHKRVQIGTCLALAVTVILFELDVRTHGWLHLARPSPYYDTWLFPLLYLHLCVAVSTTILWAYTLITALKYFPDPPQPGAFSPHHRKVARAAAIGMYCTAITGWTFYWMAFLA